jgi:hypothetical protein
VAKSSSPDTRTHSASGEAGDHWLNATVSTGPRLGRIALTEPRALSLGVVRADAPGRRLRAVELVIKVPDRSAGAGSPCRTGPDLTIGAGRPRRYQVHPSTTPTPNGPGQRGYAGRLITWAKAALQLTVTIIKRTDNVAGSVVLSRQWVVSAPSDS